MPTYNFPTLSRGPNALTWALQSMTQVHISPLSGATRTITTPGARWTFTAAWHALADADRNAVEAWLAQLNGRAGRFYYSPPQYYYPRGTARTGSVNGGSQTGSTLNAVLTAGATLLAGDFFEVNNELKRITSSVTADGAGNAALVFGPPLRASPGNGAAITLTAPKAAFMLTDDKAGVSIGAGGYTEFTVDAIEAFP